MPEINTTGALQIAGQLYEYVDVLGEKMFGQNHMKKDVHQFALAVGIAGNKILESEHYVETPSTTIGYPNPLPRTNPASQLATYDDIEAILSLIAASGKEANAQTASEYVNGGLQFLKEIGYENQTEESLDRFFEIFPHINPEGDD